MPMKLLGKVLVTLLNTSQCQQSICNYTGEVSINFLITLFFTVLDPGTKAWKELKEYFGDEVLNSDGRVNRAKLGEIIFDDIEKRRKLNAITHPRIQSAMIKMAISYFFSGHRYIVMEVPLLFETGKMLTFMHKIITVVW